MASRKVAPAFLVTLALVLLATLGSVAGARSLNEAGFTGMDSLLAAVSGSKKLHFSGVLTQNDTPVQKGQQDLRFSIWTDLTSTDATTFQKWSEVQTVQVRNGGVISVFLGSVNPFPENLFENEDVYLGIELLDTSGAVTTTFPRQELAHVPKAFRAVGASKADKLDDDKCKNCVKEGHLENQAIGKEKIKPDAVERDKIKDQAISKEKLDNKAVGREKLEDRAVGRDQVDDKAIGRDKIDDRAVGKKQLGVGAELDGLPGYSLTLYGATAFFNPGTPRTVAATIGGDGLPVIAWVSDTGVAITHCIDLGCTQATTSTVAGNFGSVGIAIGAGGNPVVVGSAGESVFCDDPACEDETAQGADAASAVALSATGDLVTGPDSQALAVGADGGIVRVFGGSVLEVQVCSGFFPCSEPGVVIDPAPAGQVAVAIDTRGRPVISYLKDGALWVAQCNDVQCAASTTSLVDDEGLPFAPSVAIGRDGHAVISYTKDVDLTSSRSLFVARCVETACGAVTKTLAVWDSVNFWAIGSDGPTSITIGRDGLPVVAFMQFGQLSVVHCSNAFCVPNARAR